MEFEKLKGLFHESWHESIRPFIESEACYKLSKELQSRRKAGVRLAPFPKNVFKCFEKCTLDDLKLVITGFCPYHTFVGNEPVADGICMSCSKTGRLQPSLEQFYWAIADTYKPEKRLRKNPDLSYLSEQGVLMFNASLTTEANRAGSDMELWKPFTKYVFEEMLNKSNKRLVHVFLGKVAGECEHLVSPFLNRTKVVQHPAAASYTKSFWVYDNVFRWVDTLLADNGKTPMVWDENLK